MNQTSVPVLLVVFNRPDTVRALMSALSKIKPKVLYVAADGARKEKPGEQEKCEETRKVATSPDWPCEVKTLFQDSNLGCKKGFAAGANWFFENVEEGIVLEDDDIPDPSFFTFASEMLERYRIIPSVMHINGSNFQFGNKRGDASYFFARGVHMWGFATWRRAWQKYDIDMKDLDEYIKSKKIYALFKDKKVAEFWISLFKHIRDKNVNTYDAQWAYTVIKSDGLVITPNVNLVQNIGFGEDATHTGNSAEFLRQKSNDIGTIIHPTSITPDLEADDFEAKKLYIVPLYVKIMNKLKALIAGK